MSKKILSVVLTIAMIATLFCMGSVVASADEAIHTGDVVEYTFYIKNIENCGGLSVDLSYNSEYLTARTTAEELQQGTYIVNAETDPNWVYWNATFGAAGQTFDDDAIITLSFDVVKDGTLTDTAISYDAWELFDASLTMYDPANNLYTTTNVQHNDVATDTDTEDTDTTKPVETDTDTEDTDTTKPVETDTDTEDTDTTKPVESDTDTTKPVESDTDTTKPVETDTDTEDTDTTKPVESDTDTTKPVESDTDKTSDSDKDSDSDKKDTKDTASKTSSTSSKTTSTKTTTTSTVQTAGTIAVVSLVVILMAAAAVVLFFKKKAEQE